jgi:hypothetical protein
MVRLSPPDGKRTCAEARRLAQPSRSLRSGAKEAHPHQPLQPEPNLAGPRPQEARPRSAGRLAQPGLTTWGMRTYWSGCWRSIWSGPPDMRPLQLQRAPVIRYLPLLRALQIAKVGIERRCSTTSIGLETRKRGGVYFYRKRRIDGQEAYRSIGEGA